MILFEFKNINYHAPGSSNLILESINFSLQSNRMIAIMGLNGAGKTTLLKLLSGFIKPTQGNILLEGNEIHSFTSKEIAQKIAFVPQDFPTEFPFTVSEFLLMGRFAWQTSFGHTEKDYEVVRLVLKRMNLENFAQRTLPSLSGGERQRALLARALAQETPIILLDEPLNHLDIKRRQEILEVLQDEVKNHGKTVLTIIHELEVARRYFDEVILLKAGKLVCHASVVDGLSLARVLEVFEVGN